MEYEWDPRKAVANLKKHGVDFAEAISVLSDDLALTIRESHPDDDRFVTMGTDLLGRILVMVYTMREEKIRLISARKATPRERKQYEN